MKKIIEKRNYIIFCLVILLGVGVLLIKKPIQEQTHNYYAFGESVIIKIYDNKDSSKIFKEIETIYEKWDKAYKSLYSKEKITSDMSLLLDYGKKLSRETNGLLDININLLVKKIEENYDMQDYLNPINIDSLIGSYVANEVQTYLKKNNIKKYLINQNGDIITGDHYNKEKYSISIHDAEDKVIKILYFTNKSLSVKGNTDMFQPYMVNPITEKKSGENKIVAVISNDIKEADMLSRVLYLLSIKEGQEFIKKYTAEALWYSEDEIITTEGMKKYLKK